MRRSQYSEEQIIAILKEAEAGKTIRELCREHGITDQTYYRWKSKYGGLEASEADLTLDNQARAGFGAENRQSPALRVFPLISCRFSPLTLPVTVPARRLLAGSPGHDSLAQFHC